MSTVQLEHPAHGAARGLDADQGGPTLDSGRARFGGQVRDYVAAHQPHEILELFKLAHERPDTIALLFGESDLVTPDFICRAATDAIAAGQTFYAARRGLPVLREQIADYLSDLHAAPVSADRITVTAGAINAMVLVMQMVVAAGDNVVLVTPAWPNSGATVMVAGGQVREVPLEPAGDGLALDLDRLFAAVDGRTRMIFINSPNNPTGWMMPRVQQQQVLEFCRSRGLWLLADEVYSRLVYNGGAAPSFLDIAEPDDALFVVNSFSKAWAMTGWRLGWLVAPAAFGNVLESLTDYNVSGVATFAQPAAVAALRDGEPFVRSLVEYCRTARDLVARGLLSIPGVRFAMPEASFYAYFQVEGVTDSFEFSKRLVRENGVGIAPGSAFGADTEGWFRLCYARQANVIEEAVRRLQHMRR